MTRSTTSYCRFLPRIGISSYVFLVLILVNTGLSQVSGFSPEEHLTSTVQGKSPQQLLADLSTARRLLNSHPSAEANVSVGLAVKALGETPQALTFFDRALELNPKLAEALFEKGISVCDSGDWSKAAELFRDAIANSANYGPAHLALGEMLLRIGEFDGARNEFDKALRIDSTNAGAHQGMALINLQQGRFDLAAAEFHQALSLRPGYIDARRGLARALASEHKWNEAVAALRNVVAGNPNSSEDATALGTALANTGDKAGAVEQFARARELSNRELTLLRAKGDSNLGISQRNEGKLQEATFAFRRAIEDDPTFCEAHDDLGEVFWMQKNQAGALQEFKSAVRCDPNSSMARNNLGSALLYYSHDAEGAIEQFRAATALKPGLTLAHLNLGKALAAKQDYSAAESELRSALALEPNSAAAHLNLGLVLAARGGRLSADARTEMEQGVRLDPRLKEMIPEQYLADVH